MRNDSRRPWKMLLPLFGVLALAAAWSAYWFIAIGIAEAAVASERRKLVERGITLRCGRETWGGYPFRFEFHCASPVLTYKDRLAASSGNLLAVALAYKPWQVVALIDGPTTATGWGLLPTRASHRRIIASVTFGQDKQPRVSADVPQLAIAGLLTVDRIVLDTRPEANGATGVASSFVKLNYRPGDRPQLVIGRGELVGTITGAKFLHVEKIELSRGTVRYWGTGDVTIDTGNRLAGKLSTETNDFDGLLAILEPHLDIPDRQKAGLRGVLGLIGNEAKADIIASDGHLFIGPFKIADLMPLY